MCTSDVFEMSRPYGFLQGNTDSSLVSMDSLAVSLGEEPQVASMGLQEVPLALT